MRERKEKRKREKREERKRGRKREEKRETENLAGSDTSADTLVGEKNFFFRGKRRKDDQLPDDVVWMVLTPNEKQEESAVYSQHV